MEYNKLKELQQTIERFEAYHKDTVPLCAAENVLSEFTKIPLCGDLQERYIMNNYSSYNINNNFIGSEFLLPFYSMVQKECTDLFGAVYSDARTLTGMNCLITLLMALTKVGDKILILSNQWGGHPSVKPVCERLGLKVSTIPYILDDYDIDYEKLNNILIKDNIDFILLAPSDIIKPLAIAKIQLGKTKLLYDISQIMGLIATGIIKNPLTISKDIILFGGTHKTLPGPASGLIITNNKDLYMQMDENINPKYLRRTQMHQVVSLLFALYELEEYGRDYMHKIVRNSNHLGLLLEHQGFNVCKIGEKYSFTHQIFIKCSKEEMNKIYKNGILYGVTLNKKEKSLFDGFGIRLGVQEISRYNWGEEALVVISQIINELRKDQPDKCALLELKKSLPEKKIAYTFPSEMVNKYKMLFSK